METQFPPLRFIVGFTSHAQNSLTQKNKKFYATRESICFHSGAIAWVYFTADCFSCVRAFQAWIAFMQNTKSAWVGQLLLNLIYLFSVSFMMVDALEENVMKDILSMGLEQNKKVITPVIQKPTLLVWRFCCTKIPTDGPTSNDMCQRLMVTALEKIP